VDKKKKKRWTQEEWLEKTINGVMDKKLKHQQDSDNKIMDLVVKRMKLEGKNDGIRE